MSEQDVIPDPENEGEGTGAVSPNKEAEALRTGMMAEREKRQTAEQESAELRGRLSALEESATRQAPGESTFTRSQLNGAVDDGRITTDEADRIYETQMEKRISERVSAQVTEATTVNAVGVEIQQYKDAMPNLLVRGSDEFAKVEKEFAWLRSTGLPDNLNTELAAMRSVFGPAEKLKADKGKPVLETHQETGGSAGDDSGGSKTGWPKDMKAETKRYYQDLINKNIVPDVAAAAKEWSYKPKHKPRHAA